MLTSDKSASVGSTRSKAAVPFALLPIAVAVTIPLLALQPKQVSAAVYSFYAAVLALVFGIVLVKRKRRAMAVGAAIACAAFTALFVVYAYSAYLAPK